MGWLSLFKSVLWFANLIGNIVREKQLMDAGEQRGVAKTLKQISINSGIAKEIELETAKMTPEEIMRDLQDSGELRD